MKRAMYSRGAAVLVAATCASGLTPANAGAGPLRAAGVPADKVAGSAVPAEHGGSSAADAVPNPAISEPISLQAILAFADRHSPILLIARARAQRSEAAFAAAAPWLPTNPSVTVGAGSRAATGARAFDYQVSLSQTIEIAGERGLRLAAAERFAEVTELEIEEARWVVHHDVHASYHDALLAREKLAIAARALQFAERLLDVAQRRLAAGDIAPLQVRIAEGELAQAEQASLAAEQQYDTARLVLAELSGWPVDTPPVPAGALDVPRQAPDAAALIVQATEHHPRLRSDVAALAEARARQDLANRERWPALTIGIGYEREADPPTGIAESITGIALTMPLPLWQRNQAERAQARADVGLADAELAALRQTLAAQVARAVVRVNAAAARIEAYARQVLPAFEQNLALLDRAFELGEIDMIELMVARGRFLEVQATALAAYDDYYKAIADLESTVGAELWPEERHEHKGAGQ